MFFFIENTFTCFGWLGLYINTLKCKSKSVIYKGYNFYLCRDLHLQQLLKIAKLKIFSNKKPMVIILIYLLVKNEVKNVSFVTVTRISGYIYLYLLVTAHTVTYWKTIHNRIYDNISLWPFRCLCMTYLLFVLVGMIFLLLRKQSANVDFLNTGSCYIWLRHNINLDRWNGDVIAQRVSVR